MMVHSRHRPSRPNDKAHAFSGCVPMLVSLPAGATCFLLHPEREDDMPDSVYKVIQLIGTSKDSWKRLPRARSSRRQKHCENFASPKSSNSISSSMPAEKLKHTAPSSTSHSSSRAPEPRRGRNSPASCEACGSAIVNRSSPRQAGRARSVVSSSSPAGSRLCQADETLHRRELWRAACGGPTRLRIFPVFTNAATAMGAPSH